MLKYQMQLHVLAQLAELGVMKKWAVNLFCFLVLTSSFIISAQKLIYKLHFITFAQSLMKFYELFEL
jgi:hypothetical protein